MNETNKSEYSVTFIFKGKNAEQAAEWFYHFGVDGGLEDIILEAMEENGHPVWMSDIDNEKRIEYYTTGYEPE
ncbi:MAG: hypothetical protein LBM77_04350 [Spirochaetaceae bacterium]|jgi:hypothetical protein|nr:hypothetical protein [Spirochaetaceae bacterium]